MHKLFILLLIFYSPSFADKPKIISDSLKVIEAENYLEKCNWNKPDSIPYFKKSLKIEHMAIKLKNYDLLARVYQTHAYYFFHTRDYLRAIEEMKYAIIYARYSHRKERQMVFFNLFIAHMYDWLDKQMQTLNYINIAQNYVGDNKEHLYSAQKLRFNIYTRMKQYNIAYHEFKKYENTIRDPKIKYKEEYYLRMKGFYLRRLNKEKEAKRAYDKLLKLKNLSPFGATSAYLYTGYAYKKINKSDSARHFFKKVFINNSSPNVMYYKSLATTKLLEMEIEKGNIGRIPQLIDSLKKYKSTRYKANISRSWLVNAKAYFVLGKQDSTIKYLNKAFKYSSNSFKKYNTNRFRVMEKKLLNPIVENLVKYYYANPAESNQDTLFNYANIVRGNTIVERTQQYENPIKTYFYEYQEKLRRFQRRSRLGIPDTIANRAKEHYNLKHEVVKGFIEQFKDSVISHSQATLPEFQKYLKQNNSVSILYNVNYYNSFLQYITPDSAFTVDLNINIDQLKKDIKYLRGRALRTDDVNTAQYNAELAHNLYTQLWQPLAKQIKLPENIIIIPDMVLSNLPFEMLLKKRPSQPKYTIADENDYVEDLLVMQHNISYLPTAHMIKMFKAKHKRQKLLLFSNPEFGEAYQMDKQLRTASGWDFSPLIHSATEAKEIKPYFNNVTAFEKEAATKTNFYNNIGSHSVVHFATHAFVDTLFDHFSGLALSLGSDSLDDGLLMGYELKRLKFHSDLVTLSACETGNGRLVRGEGILGLPRLFFSGGARSVLMSVWKVDDRFSAEMMPLFYKSLMKEGSLKSVALGKAKRQMIKQGRYAHPIYWASYNLYGDVSTLEQESSSLYYYLSTVILLALIIIISRKRLFSRSR